MIRFEHVTKVLGGKSILDNVSFEIDEGEIFVIVGPSGVGKSVTLKHMVRLLTPDDGRILVGDDVVSEAHGRGLEKIRERFGYLFQGGALLAWLNIVENVALPLHEKTDMPRDEITAKAREVLAMVGLEDAGVKTPSEISGGMQKRAGLARAIVRNPEIVLYDEPTSGLDPVTARTIDALIDRLRKEVGITSVVVTHDLHSALSIGTRIAMLHGGKIIELSTPEQFVKSPRPEVQNFLESQFITKEGSWERSL
ncbi:MAG: ATP-binding cassette domain-containing protein [Kiritimatiellia bacterium]|jgi:phospholipid/cholesterol/gamma-HCH transport system ATP-binding protein|nr:ATP-binding cassette domain-containing protein [Kiritimatiellia bacterium]MDP6847227.1 ATP-binding cassette domain-containing protein [Kiritimatiellia bacterium]